MLEGWGRKMVVRKFEDFSRDLALASEMSRFACAYFQIFRCEDKDK
jgi:hypothetical protein